MAHMRPEVTTKQDWAGVETTAGFWWVPFSVLSKSEIESVKRGEFGPLLKYTEAGKGVIDSLSSVKKGYGVRLSAPGYLDSTEWEVYGSEKEAKRRARELIEEEKEEGTPAPGVDYATKKKTKFSNRQIGGYLQAARELTGISFNDNYNKATYGITKAEFDEINRAMHAKYGMFPERTLTGVRKALEGSTSSHHSTVKKTPAQLDREIAEALAQKRTQSPYSVHTPEWERGRQVRKLERQKARLQHSGGKSSPGKRHHSSMSDDEKIRAAIARFPSTFGLRGFPGDVFRLSPTASYVSGGRVLLYTQRKDGNQWLDFSKGTEPELRREVTS